MPLPLAAGSLQGLSLLRAGVNRVIGLPDLLASLAGLRPSKRLRLQVILLRDEEGEPVAPLAEVEAALAETARVLELAARTRLVPTGDSLVVTADGPAPAAARAAPGPTQGVGRPHRGARRRPPLPRRAGGLARAGGPPPPPAPAAALDAPCTSQGLWRTDLGPAGGFFRGLRIRGGLRFIGRGAPLTVFVVRDVVGKCGCSLGPLGDYVTVDAEGLGGRTRRILAHELGHSCGLRHKPDERNLMRPKGPGEELTVWQTAVFRSSRHVTYL